MSNQVFYLVKLLSSELAEIALEPLNQYLILDIWLHPSSLKIRSRDHTSDIFPSINVLMTITREIIRSTRRTTDVVLLDLPTNKMFLFMQMWHHLIIFIFYSLCWLEVHSHICINDIISLVGRTTLAVPLVDLIISPVTG